MDSTTARRLLEAERARLRVTRHALEHDQLDRETEEDSFTELSHADQHPADIASEVFEREKDFGILATVDAALDALDDAVRAVEAGTYGTCHACGGPIAEERLRSLPAARYCTAHQEALEAGSLLAMAGESYAAVGDARSAEDDAAHEAMGHLDYLPTDEVVEERDEAGAEDAAMHITRPT